jgi:multimeric flavodoxin WrbA
VARLLVVHHTASPALQAMFEQVLAGAGAPEIEGVEVVRRPALTAGPADVLSADGYLLGGPVNIGYLSGAVKHFFDTVYYPCLDSTVGRPFSYYLHGASDATGAVRAMEQITGGLRWQPAAAPVVVVGAVGRGELESCWELGATVAATVGDVSG